ncbi:MAG: hypothetical protein NZL85_03370, partial [Fimbriimonadales bacterium]|nr:hypothetical protein [Fimbriimonadales bacterium]
QDARATNTRGWLYGQDARATGMLRWTVRPGSEGGVLTSSTRSRIEGDRRIVGRRGIVTYSFRLLSGMDVQIQLTVGGNGRVRIRTPEQGLLLQRIAGRVQTYTLVTRTPYRPPIQTLQVVLEADRRGQVVFYGLTLRATQRDEDGDGIGDSTERLLGAPANALKPMLPQGGTSEPIEGVMRSWVQTPALLGGEYQVDPFSMVFLRCSMLAGWWHHKQRHLTLAIDPMLDLAVRDPREHLRTCLGASVATLMFPEIRPIISIEPSREQLSALPPDYAAVIFSAARAVEAMAESEGATLDAGAEGIGMLVSDSPLPDESDSLALALPLVRAGVPLQMRLLSRVAEHHYLRNVRLLLWTPEAVSPLGEAEVDALASWVRGGGWLLAVGAPNGAGASTPLHGLVARLGLSLNLSDLSDKQGSSDAAVAWQEVARHGTQPERGTLNRRWLEIDLSPYAGQTLYVRFSDSLPDTGGGALLRQARLEADGRILTAFYTGTPIERLFLYAHSKSLLTRNGERVVDGMAWFVYRFPLPAAVRITLRVEIAQEWRVELSTQPPYPERVLVRQRTDLPMLTLRHDERLTACELPGAEALYLYQSSSPGGGEQGAGVPVGLLQPVGRGGIALIGVSGRAFGNSPNGEMQLRQLIRFVAGRAGLRYRERARFTVRRGDWVAAYGTYRLTILRGVYLDALDPRLPVLTDVPLEPRTPRLLLRVDEHLKRAGMLHTNAQIVLQHTTPAQLAYLLRGPEGALGVARVSIRGLKGQVQLLDGVGNPAAANVERSGGTLLIRWNLSQSGHVLIVR